MTLYRVFDSMPIRHQNTGGKKRRRHERETNEVEEVPNIINT